MEPKLLSRDAFRDAVFARDHHKCVFCGAPAKDAHHVLERRLWPDGGYYLENGASVCEAHHLACERTTISVEEVRHACGTTKIVVPPHLYADHVYDKWGNPLLEDGRRARGELFFDESVQKALAAGGVLDLFTFYVKYPRTLHLPWSPGMHEDDRMLKDTAALEGKRVVVTEKMDGENTSLYCDHIHARSIDSRGGEERAWVKQFWSSIAHEIPPGWRICGENLWAEHSISYANLSSYFYGFSVWNARNECLGWDDTQEWFSLLDIQSVPVLYRGAFDERAIRAVEKSLDWNKSEGYVVRLEDSFAYSAFKTSAAKFVREDHIKTTRHWRAGMRFSTNKLAP
jgi:hypothetical protein